MKTKLLNVWEKLRSSYWFLPSVMAVGAVVLASAALWTDYLLPALGFDGIRWLSWNEVDGARALLSTVAGSVITVTGVVFSVTVVALSLASQQFGPRLLYNFMRDRGNQFAFGSFIATYLYCLLILRTIRGTVGDAFVPHFSVLIAFLLALVTVGVLIYFIHHVAESIQAMEVIASVSDDLHRTIDRLFPGAIDLEPRALPAAVTAATAESGEEREAWSVSTTRRGYLQAIDLEGLMALAREHDLEIHCAYRPGQFVVEGHELVRVLGEVEDEDREELAEDLQAAFLVGRSRTQEQDAEFLVHELVEIAVRALSPGVNDPFTAISCVDYLGSALGILAGRALPHSQRYDDDGDLRLVIPVLTFASLVTSAFDPVRHHGGDDPAILRQLLQTLTAILKRAAGGAQADILLRQGLLVDQAARQRLTEAAAREEIHELFAELFAEASRRFGISGEGLEGARQ